MLFSVKWRSTESYLASIGTGSEPVVNRKWTRNVSPYDFIYLLLTDNSEVSITLFSVKRRSTESYLASIGTRGIEVHISKDKAVMTDF